MTRDVDGHSDPCTQDPPTTGANIIVGGIVVQWVIVIKISIIISIRLYSIGGMT